MASQSPLFALLTGDKIRAADLYYQAGRLDKAAELYAKAGNFRQAAKISAELGHSDRAVELYVKSGAPQLAAEVLVAAGRHKDALALFENAGAFWPAAQAALAIGQTGRAARYYERAKAWAPAAAAFERANMPEDALRMFEQELRRLEAEPPERADPTAREALRTLRLKRAELLGKLGRVGEAAVALRLVGLHGQAAPLFERARAWRDALEAFLAAGDLVAVRRLADQVPDLEPARRAQILQRCGAWLEVAPLLLSLGQVGEAAEAFDNASEWAQAAPLWEQANEPQRAAESYLRAERPADAARCFALVGSHQAAAEAYAKAGRHREAAELYERTGQYLRAATHFLEAGEKGRGMTALQSVETGGVAFERATLLLVPLLIDEGLAEAAMHRLQMLPGDRGTGLAVFDRMYWEGRVLEALGRTREAHDTYQRLLALRRDHRDLAKRAADLAAKLEAEAKQAPPGSGGHGSGPRGNLNGSGTQQYGGSTDSAANLQVGSQLADRYEIQGELGRGGMSRVFRARDRVLDEVVAIKTLLRPSEESSVEEERLLREVQICRRITHANVVRVYDIGRFGGGIFITMELIDGQRLDALIHEQRTLPLSQVRHILLQTVAGLAAAHELGIVHRDLKPGNIILSAKGLKILDFGIARQEGQDTRLTSTGEAMGSPMYMSPEQIQGLPLDGRSDLYALGVMAFTLLAGREPFHGKTATAVAVQHLHHPPPDIASLRPGLPSGWVDLINRLLAKKASERPVDAAAVAAELNDLPE
jgi:tetratricopeptide (TPR) repeat protein/tRNA A-37 threonylcarbamoyl transferase component Bud32